MSDEKRPTNGEIDGFLGSLQRTMEDIDPNAHIPLGNYEAVVELRDFVRRWLAPQLAPALASENARLRAALECRESLDMWLAGDIGTDGLMAVLTKHGYQLDTTGRAGDFVRSLCRVALAGKAVTP